MIVKGIELFKMIADGKIKDRTVINRIGNDDVFKYEYRNGNLIYSEIENIINIFSLKKILDLDFEILEDEIDNIKEFKVSENKFIKTETGTWSGRKMDVAFANKINELVRAVNSILNQKGDVSE